MVRLACRRNSSRSVVNALGGRHTGGQTALKLAEKLEKYGIKIIGTSFAALDMAEDRERFSSLLRDLGIPYPAFGAVNNPEEAVKLSRTLCFPLLVRRCGNPWVG